MADKCKATVFRGFYTYRCSRNAVKDEYCLQHHPDSVKKRSDAAEKRYQEKRQNSDWFKLKTCVQEKQQLEQELATLRAQLEAEQKSVNELSLANQDLNKELADLRTYHEDQLEKAAQAGLLLTSKKLDDMRAKARAVDGLVQAAEKVDQWCWLEVLRHADCPDTGEILQNMTDLNSALATLKALKP